LYDGVILGKWIDGLKGETRVKPELMQQMMNKLYNYVEVENKIAYQKLQIKGITSHAWLIVGMKKSLSGFDIGFIDSNNPKMSENYSYKFNDESFFDKSYGHFVPYLEFTREELKILNVSKIFCGIKVTKPFTQTEIENDYQLDLEEAKADIISN
jgi:hypothetical protein